MSLRSVVPALPVRQVTSAVQHYAAAYSFRCLHLDPDGFAVVERDGVVLHLWQAGDDGWRLRPPASLAEAPVVTGAESFIAGTASCRIEVDGVDTLYAELAATGVLHRTDAGHPVATDHGTREFATSDADGNLLTFYEPA